MSIDTIWDWHCSRKPGDQRRKVNRRRPRGGKRCLEDLYAAGDQHDQFFARAAARPWYPLRSAAWIARVEACAVTFPKKKLLVVLGAGSSIRCGMPSVEDLDTKMKEWCREWEWRGSPYISEADGQIYCQGYGVYNDLSRIIEEYYCSSRISSPRLRLNFEKVLGEMIALAFWVTPAPFGNALKRAVRDGELSSRFTWS
jgi:hypothetical protein